MSRRLSSLQTPLMKILLPLFWIPFWGFGTVILFFGRFEGGDPDLQWIFLFGSVGGFVLIYWSCMRLKAVRVDDNFLYVSNYLKEISIPLSEIYDVTENAWINIHPVTIHLKSPSEFGEEIVFMPKARYFAFFNFHHPVVDELKELVKSAHWRKR